MSENGLQKSANQRVRHQLPGLRLRNEQSSYEEWMIGNLDDSDFSIKVSARYDQIRVSSQCVGVLGIDSESTVVAFDYFKLQFLFASQPALGFYHALDLGNPEELSEWHRHAPLSRSTFRRLKEQRRTTRT